MKKLVCDVCGYCIDMRDCYDEDGYSQFVTVQTLDSRQYGSEEYEICNGCYEKILKFVATIKETQK